MYKLEVNHDEYLSEYPKNVPQNIFSLNKHWAKTIKIEQVFSISYSEWMIPIQMLIKTFQHHTVRQHGLCLPGRQETSLPLHLGGLSSRSVSPFEKLPVNDYLHKFMLYMGFRHTTVTLLIATVLNYMDIFSSR